MSNPGMMMAPQMDLQKRQQMALALLQQGMQGQAMQANPSSPYAGVTNAGGNIVNALNYRNIQQANDPLGPVVSTPSPVTGQGGSPSLKNWMTNHLSNLFGLGGN